MPKYKLIYFNLRARGEIIRLLFSLAGVPFEDYRVDLDEHFNPAAEYAEIKKAAPFGQLPVLEVDGENLAQSHAIERFLAREFGLDGETSLQKAKVDMWIEGADEILRRVSDNIEEHDAKKKAADKNRIMTVVAPAVLGALEKTLSLNKGGFIVGDKLTVADVAFFSVQDWLKSAYKEEGVSLVAGYKAVDQHLTKISKIPAVADWVKKRPETPF
ncbi:hematopoietic prostaglandin D synthase-like [Liolophura sinensis]|uniref:hematopoietic prostaglandin D synthase-like n=1 Tax=Liolophura sinensis TaxID=3198878 RepID=UPI0031594633